jgi:hypothetical protein
MKGQTRTIEEYGTGLANSDTTKTKLAIRGSEVEKGAIENFYRLWDNFTPEYIEKEIDKHYAASFHFNDGLNTFTNLDDLRAHMTKQAKATARLQMEFTDVAYTEGNWYFRWYMTIEAPAINKGKPMKSMGMSHIRFNHEGRIVLHQDYWDSASGLYEYIPLMGSAIRFVRSKF